MSYNIDSVIFIGFLAANLIVGLFYSRNVKNIREYAIGKRNFSSTTIAATIAATWIGGGVLSQTITETYKQGLYFIIPVFGDSLVLLVIGYFLAPRMAEFLGTLSIGEAMSNLYGKNVRIITTLIGIISCVGAVAVQFKVSSTILQLLFNVSSHYAVLISAIIVVLYSAVGGIKAVTFTDVVQIFTFATIIPIISFIIWGTLGDPHKVYLVITENPLFDYKQVFDFYNPKLLDSFLLFLFFIIPTLEPAIFQRISMAKNTMQIRKSFIIASFICLAISLVICWIGVLLLAGNADLDPNALLPHIINNYSYSGLKGLIAIGVMAVIMSTADSYINSAAVLFTHDFCKPLGIRWITNHQLSLSRISAVFVGIVAYFLAFNTKSILELTFLIWGSYMPIISVPLLLAILGFRSTPKAVLIGMSAGVATICIFNLFNFKTNSTIPAMLANILFFMGSHYLLRQKGGWVGIRDKKPLEDIRKTRKRRIYTLIRSIKNFNFVTFCQSNTPQKEMIYSSFGVFCIISIFSTMYSLPLDIREQYKVILEYIYHFVLISSAIFLTYPIWPPTLKNKKFIAIFWNIGIFSILVFIAGFLVAISNFSQFQLMIFILNLIVISILLRWQVALFIIFAGVIASLEFFKWYIGFDNLSANINSLQFKVMYSLLLFSSVLIAFLKPQQERNKLTEQKADHLGERIYDRDEELEKLIEVKNEFLRNLEHEAHTPIVGITSMGQILFESYDKLTENQRRKGLEEIAKSSERLSSLVNNMIDLSKLLSLNYTLDKKEVDLSELIYDRLDYCKKLYLNGKELQFFTKIEDNIKINCDEHYIKSTLDNLIINAIQYSKEGNITLELHKNSDSTAIHFSIQDEGIAIPQAELYDIFFSFIVSSRTKTPAGGRGIGLALCKKAITTHGGEIWAESDGAKGSTFRFTLPM
ncbi:Solute carrier and signal transduction histidine kinase domain protein [Candidatus Megaera venefica]|uniref:histidine kinase n=1 Tax=Candidatus Megaera venefica TaxID=2055910 RepID=A0ABU5NDU3_9RICK|nr:ATP-binding protein [Candidatus Megaera venefica]MEA0971357.1 Solute carrier and signal transduction histidine kinase domain protein [Candidatus Megaera venefica]